MKRNTQKASMIILKKMSMAGKLIRNQAEQIREDPAEYVARKYGIRGDADEGTERIN